MHLYFAPKVGTIKKENKELSFTRLQHKYQFYVNKLFMTASYFTYL